MNAGPQSIVSLLTSANQRMVIPVYQRAYSWDEDQCRQLWDDIVAIGRRSSARTSQAPWSWCVAGSSAPRA